MCDEKSQPRCWYTRCQNPCKSQQFYYIEKNRTSGEKDWSELYGKTLCDACYRFFKGNSTLERKAVHNLPLASHEKRCTYVGCKRPDKSPYFLKINRNQAGGRDWSSVVGHVLCSTCYTRFKRTGSLEGKRKRSNLDLASTHAEPVLSSLSWVLDPSPDHFLNLDLFQDFE